MFFRFIPSSNIREHAEDSITYLISLKKMKEIFQDEKEKRNKSWLRDKMHKTTMAGKLGQIFFISWFTNPPTVILRKVGKK